MKMHFVVLSKLFHSSYSLLIAGYGFLFLSLFLLIFKQDINVLNLTLCICAILIGLLHHYVSIRVIFDAKLLQYLSKKIDYSNIDSLTKELDQSLITLKLMPIDKANRSWKLRLIGCQKLFKIQIFIFLIQIFMLIFMFFYVYNA